MEVLLFILDTVHAREEFEASLRNADAVVVLETKLNTEEAM